MHPYTWTSEVGFGIIWLSHSFDYYMNCLNVERPYASCVYDVHNILYSVLLMWFYLKYSSHAWPPILLVLYLCTCLRHTVVSLNAAYIYWCHTHWIVFILVQWSEVRCGYICANTYRYRIPVHFKFCRVQSNKLCIKLPLKLLHLRLPLVRSNHI